MSAGDIPAKPGHPQSDAERAMSANARSRDRQGKAEDRARRAFHPGPKGDDAQDGDDGRPGAGDDEPAEHQGSARSRAKSGAPRARPQRSLAGPWPGRSKTRPLPLHDHDAITDRPKAPAKISPKPNKPRSPLCERIRLAMEMKPAYPLDD